MIFTTTTTAIILVLVFLPYWRSVPYERSYRVVSDRSWWRHVVTSSYRYNTATCYSETFRLSFSHVVSYGISLSLFVLRSDLRLLFPLPFLLLILLLGDVAVTPTPTGAQPILPPHNATATGTANPTNAPVSNAKIAEG